MGSKNKYEKISDAMIIKNNTGKILLTLLVKKFIYENFPVFLSSLMIIEPIK